jgi:hypothetical protein
MTRRRHLSAMSALCHCDRMYRLAKLRTVDRVRSQQLCAERASRPQRELQQINNQIISLQNQAQMLVNQA